MRTRQLGLATFTGTPAAVQDALARFTSGQAVTAVQSGTVAYAAGTINQHSLERVESHMDGGTLTVCVFYAKG